MVTSTLRQQRTGGQTRMAIGADSVRLAERGNMAWRPAKSLVVLRQQANELWPNRSRASDGLIGDAAHAATPSDHNPTPDTNVVCAFDLTHDPSNGCNCDAISESIRLN